MVMDQDQEKEKVMVMAQFGLPVEVLREEERRKGGSDTFFRDWKALWWRPVPDGCGTSILEPMEPSVIAVVDVAAIHGLQHAFRKACTVLRNLPPNYGRSMRGQIREMFFRNECVVNVVRREDGSYAAIGMNCETGLRAAFSHCSPDVTIFTYLLPISEEVAQQLVKEYASVIAVTVARIAEEQRVVRTTAFFKALDPQVARRWSIPAVSSKEAKAGIMAYSGQENGTARGCRAEVLKRDAVAIFGTSLLGDQRLEAGVRAHDEDTAIRRAMAQVPGAPTQVTSYEMMDVLQLTDGTFVLRMLSILNLNHWSGGGDKGETWIERDMLVPVTEAVARASVEAIRKGFEAVAEERKQAQATREAAQAEEARIQAMRSFVASKQLDEKSIEEKRSAVLVREKLDPVSVNEARREALLAGDYSEADIQIVLARGKF